MKILTIILAISAVLSGCYSETTTLATTGEEESDFWNNPGVYANVNHVYNFEHFDSPYVGDNGYHFNLSGAERKLRIEWIFFSRDGSYEPTMTFFEIPFKVDQEAKVIVFEPAAEHAVERIKINPIFDTRVDAAFDDLSAKLQPVYGIDLHEETTMTFQLQDDDLRIEHESDDLYLGIYEAKQSPTEPMRASFGGLSLEYKERESFISVAFADRPEEILLHLPVRLRAGRNQLIVFPAAEGAFESSTVDLVAREQAIKLIQNLGLAHETGRAVLACELSDESGNQITVYPGGSAMGNSFEFSRP